MGVRGASLPSVDRAGGGMRWGLLLGGIALGGCAGEVPVTCVGDIPEPLECGLNGRGVLPYSCEGSSWVAAETCLDIDECKDGNTELSACGLNDRGERARVCDVGRWTLRDCVDPDICEDGLVQSQTCGLNDRGRLDRTCVFGDWEPGECVDPDVCVDGDSERLDDERCGSGERVSTCESGQWDRGYCITSLLDFTIQDAVYDAVNERIVVASGEPESAVVLMDGDQVTRSVALSRPPVHLSVSPDGSMALVGHLRSVTAVDLDTGGVIGVFEMATEVRDVLARDGGFGLVLGTASFGAEVTLDVNTGATAGTSFGRWAHQVVLHPAGDRAYGASRGVSPSDFVRFEFDSSTLVYGQDSAYHGDYAFSGDGNIWISEDGARLFASSGNVFRSRSSRSGDMSFSGRLFPEGQTFHLVRHVSTSVALDRVFSLVEERERWEETDITEMTVHDRLDLSVLGTVEAPPITLPNDRIIAGNLRYVFPRADGAAVYLIQQGETGSGLVYDWSVATLEPAALP